MISKKVILFIVEGITDEISLGNIVTKINKNEKIYFQIVTSDIASNEANNSTNIFSKITEQIKICMQRQQFKKKDIIKVVHLVDTDGAFANDDCIKYKNIDKVEYENEFINTKNIKAIRERNLKKASILSKLCATNYIYNIPYRIYFFSTNLEHVLHNVQNPKDSEKEKMAMQFEDKFYNEPEKFIDFINNDEYALKDEYYKTWGFIKIDNNSLKRYTNFNLFFRSDKDGEL